MTSEQLIAEGRRLQRPCLFLRPEAYGALAATWHDWNLQKKRMNPNRPLVTIDARRIPGNPLQDFGYLTVFIDEANCKAGKVEVASSWPTFPGTKLYAYPAEVLPPIEAVFARGSEEIGAWLTENSWSRDERYNDNFADREIVAPYMELWQKEFPLYFDSDIYAMLGGWHWPGADSDWYDLIDDQLMVLTFREAEPWVEAWRTRGGAFKIIQRIT
jgi:hypothetical protein